MKVLYDRESDVAIIRFSTGKRAYASDLEKKGVFAHFTDDGQLVELEIVQASRRLPIRNLFTLTVAQAA